jgi:hypothetical protein
MSMAEILEELPKLSQGERRELYRRILSPEVEQAESDSCDQAAAEAFVLNGPDGSRSCARHATPEGVTSRLSILAWPRSSALFASDGLSSGG